MSLPMHPDPMPGRVRHPLPCRAIEGGRDVTIAVVKPPSIPPAILASHGVTRWDAGVVTPVTDLVAEETPVSFVYNGTAFAVMMASPADLEDYAFGFTLSEGVVRTADELRDVEVVALDEGILIRACIPEERAEFLATQRRNLVGRTACGLCGAESIDQVLRHPLRLPQGTPMRHDALHRGFDALSQRQSLNAATGAVHAAAWVDDSGTLQLVREDIGRHNALDKLIGAMVRAGLPLGTALLPHTGRPPGTGLPLRTGAVLITSRASFEMAQKSAIAGIPILAAISAPTGLAIRLAEQAGLTLVGFARDGRHNVYTHPERLID